MTSIKQSMDRTKFFSAIYLMLLRDGKILLQKRANTGFHDGDYSLVSGHLDGGRTVAEEMIREAKEEIGIEIREENLQVVHVTHQIGDREYIDFFLLASDWIGDPINSEPEFCSEIAWFPIESLPVNLVANVRKALHHYLKGDYFSEFDWSKSK